MKKEIGFLFLLAALGSGCAIAPSAQTRSRAPAAEADPFQDEFEKFLKPMPENFKVDFERALTNRRLFVVSLPEVRKRELEVTEAGTGTGVVLIANVLSVSKVPTKDDKVIEMRVLTSSGEKGEAKAGSKVLVPISLVREFEWRFQQMIKFAAEQENQKRP